MAGCYKEDFDLCVEEAVTWGCAWFWKPEAAMVEEIVSLGKSMGPDMDDSDITELIEEHSKELTME